MAITTAGFQGTVSETQEANRFSRIAPPFLVASSTDLKVTTTTGTRAVSVAAGSAQVCGVTVTSDVATVLNHASNAGSTRLDVIVLRVTWSGVTSSAVIAIKQGTSGSPTPPALTRTVGVLYEAPLAVVSVGTGVSTIASASIFNVATYAGVGGRLRVLQETYCSVADAAAGAEMVVEGTTRVYRRNGDGSWTLVSDVLSAWRFFDPILRFKGAGSVQPGTAYLGTGGVRRGRYKIIDQMLIGEVELRTGSVGYNFGVGDFTLDLPPGYPPDTYFADRWQEAHVYTTDAGLMDWQSQLLLKGGETTGLLYAPRSAADCRQLPSRSTDVTQTIGHGIPYIAGAHTEPMVIIVNLSYSIAG